MDETKRSASSNQNQEPTPRSVFWGTVALAVILLLISLYFLIFMLRQPGGAVVYVATGLFAVSTATTITSLLLTFRHRQDLGLRFAFFTLPLIGTIAVGLFQGRALTASLSILVVAMLAVRWLFPSPLRRIYALAAVVGFILMWVIEWVNPPWRIQLAAARIGPGAAAVFGTILTVLAFVQSKEVFARQFRSYSLRTKFLVSIISITGLSVVIFGLFALYRAQQSQTFWSSELQSTVQQQSKQQAIDSVQFEAHKADGTLSQITNAIVQLADYRATLYGKSISQDQGSYWDGNTNLFVLSGGQYGNAPSDPASVFIPNIVTLDQALIADLNNSIYLDFSAPAVLQANPNIVALYFISAKNFTVYYPNVDLANNVPPDFNALIQPFFTVAAPKNDPERKAMWTEPYQDPAGTGLIVTNAVPVYDQHDRFRGVLAADIQLSKISDQISMIKLGENGFAFLIDTSGHIISMPDAGYKLFGFQPEVVPVNESLKTTLLGQGPAELQDIAKHMVAGENDLATVTIQGAPYYIAYAPLPTIGYSIGLIAPTAELDATYLTALEKIGGETRTTTNLSLLILLVVLLVSAGVSLILSKFISTPLVQLIKVATEVSKGNLDVRAEVKTTDEIGLLANTFNKMTSQLRETLATMEERVAERTQSLELAADVGRSVSQVRTLDVMLKEACDLILEQFDLYYVQVYLANPNQTALVLEAGTGAVGAELLSRGHRLPLNTGSINGRAAVEKRTVVISYTVESATFRPNPLLPDTRAEMAVPLIVGDEVVGVLDMQSNTTGGLTDEALPAFEALAGQLAVAIQNAKLLAEAEQARAEVEAQARRLARSGWDEYLDAVHKPEQVGFLYDQNKVVPLTDVDEPQLSAEGQALRVPIAITGEPIGSLVVEIDEGNQNPQTAELVNIVARQVAQQLENLRLLESAERYRFEAEEATRLQTREGWREYINSRTADSLGYLYDLKEVRPYTNGHDDASAFTLSLKVRDEKVGKLSVQGLTPDDQESVELVNAVAERLGAHIESLRQYGQTQSALAQSGKLFDASRRLTQAADLQELMKATIESLAIPEIDRAILGILHYGSGDELEGMTIAANWSSDTGPQVTPVGTYYPIEALKAISLFLGPNPLFFDDMFHDERVDEVMLDIPKRLNYRAVAALPLYIGSRQDAVLLLEGEKPHHFTQDEMRLFTVIAPQIATVVENRRQYERAQLQADRESKLNVISQKIQSATSVEAVLQIAARELGHALGAPMTIAQLSIKGQS